jgi:glucokinase
VRAAPNLGWLDVPLAALLREALHLPVLIRNNVHAMAAGEVRFAGVGERNAVYVYVGTGIGAGIIIDGRVHEGMHGAAGEIGHLIVAGGGACTCGKMGCLETVAAEPAIVRLAGKRDPHTGGYKPAVARIVDSALRGNRHAIEQLTRIAESLGVALAQVVEIVDPGAVILNGVIAEAGDVLLRPLADALHRSAFAARGRSVAVRAARFGRQAGMIGAATLALDEYVYQPHAELFAQRTVDRRAFALARLA